MGQAHDIVNNLLQGQKNIDRMKEEIKALLDLVGRFILETQVNEKGNSLLNHNPEFSVRTATCKWCVSFAHSANGLSAKFECSSYRFPNGEERLVFSTINGRLAGENVQFVHEMLYVLIIEVKERYPEVVKRWDYLIQASQKKFDQQ